MKPEQYHTLERLGGGGGSIPGCHPQTRIYEQLRIKCVCVCVCATLATQQLTDAVTKQRRKPVDDDFLYVYKMVISKLTVLKVCIFNLMPLKLRLLEFLRHNLMHRKQKELAQLTRFFALYFYFYFFCIIFRLFCCQLVSVIYCSCKCENILDRELGISLEC